jgi:hypothetical protein
MDEDDDTEIPLPQIGDREASMGTLLSGLPSDEKEKKNEDDAFAGKSNSRSNGRVSFLGTLQEFAQSGGDDSANGFDISDDEVEALTTLAKLSDQISSIDLEDDDFDYADLGTTPNMPMPAHLGRSTSNARASMRSISLAGVQEEESGEDTTSEVEDPSPGSTITATSGQNPTTADARRLAREEALQHMSDNGATGIAPDVPLPMPHMARRNTCGTIYVGSTMSAPDKDATIKVRQY